ncbi:unnamed protein product [Closterium sp. NIES-65]|nr:unnamed protein product [Closterium sp. NIES-65]
MRKFPIGPRTGELAVWSNVFLVVRAPEEGQYGFMLSVWRNVILVVRAPQEGQYGFMLCDKEHKQNQDNITFDPCFLFPQCQSHTYPPLRLTALLCCPPLSCRPTPLLPAPLLPACPSSAAPSLSHFSLLQKLPSLVPPNSTLYIATNEPDPHFFDPLKTAYIVHNLADFASLWGEGSAWEAEMREVAASVGVAVGKSVEFDSEMQVLVDYALKKVARRTVERFNDLTGDPKDGEMRWRAVRR